MSAYRRMPLVLCALLLIACTPALIGHAGAAGPYDGSKPLLCAVANVMECDDSGKCERHLNDDNDHSITFLRIDVGAKTVKAGNRMATVKAASNIDGALILQGGENGRGWSATIAEDTGRMAAAIVDNDHTFSIFGGCTLP
ncbi:MAG TPA: hypothetical protein VFX14_10375 [Methylomirabilota bacterium]|nr:hypothetical protein [Methylomirabilota bacterium]